ncbi:MAG: T9SS type A sorting domain-containing protein [Bacteroidota bacterium]
MPIIDPRQFLILSFIGLMALPLIGQRPNIPAQPPYSLTDYQEAFCKWETNKQQYKDEKGWKWLKRWEEHWSRRAMPDGSLPDPLMISKEVQTVASWKYREQQASRSSGWFPAGPTTLPPGTFPTSQHGMGRINCISFHPTDSNTFWVGVAQGGVWKTTDHGTNWTPLTDDLPMLRISDIAVNPQNTDEIYISVGDYAYLAVSLELDDRKRHTHYGIGVYKTTDGGQNWAPTGLVLNQEDQDASLTRRVFIRESDPQELVAAGIFGLKKSYDGGQTWVQKLDSLMWDLEVHPTQPDVLFASSGFVHALQEGSAAIMKSTDFGETWTELNTGIPPKNVVQRIELEISPANPDYIYAMSCDLFDGFHALYRSTDGGNSWTEQSNGSSTHNLLYWYLSFNGQGGQGTYDLAIVADPADPDIIYVGGVNVWGSKDGGVEWEPATLWYSAYGKSLHADQHFFSYNPLDNQFYVCNDGGVMRTKEIITAPLDTVLNRPNFQWETIWEDLNDGMQITSFYRLGLSLSHPGALIAGAQDNSTFYYDGQNWLNSVGGDGMECLIHPDNPLDFFASSQFGRIVHSSDGGDNYYTISSPITHETDELAEWTTPFQLQPGNPSVLLAGYSNLWKTSDKVNWTKHSDFPPMAGSPVSAPASALAVAPSDTQVIYLAHRIYHSFNQPSRMWRTNNAGGNWTEITAGLPDSLYFSYIAVDPDDPQHLWVSSSGFVAGTKVFESKDGGDTWSNISKNLPNLPANCLVAQDSSESNLLYVGMDRGVYYLSDSLDEWQLYADNLPNVIVSELAIHPETNQLYVATFGRGIWTSDQVSETIDPPLSNDPALKNGIRALLFPNPNSGQFSLQLETDEAERFLLQIVDILGRKVYEQQWDTPLQSLEHMISLEVPEGLYFLRIKGNTQSRVLRFRIDR